MMIVVLVLAATGFFVSLYGFGLEKRVKAGAVDNIACDINDRISCSKPILSGYNVTLGLSNTVWGMAYYGLQVLLVLSNMNTFVFWLTLIALIGSVYLAFILVTKVRALCLLCVSIYAINSAMFIISYMTLTIR